MSPNRRLLIVALVLISGLLVAPLSCFADTAVLHYLTRDGKSSIETSRVISRDGKLAFYRKLSITTRQLVVMDLQTEKETVLERVGYSSSPMWSPDGKSLAYNWRSGRFVDHESRLRLWRVEGKTPRTLAKSPAYYSEPVWSPNGRYIAVRKTYPGRKRTTATIVDLVAGMETEVNPRHVDSGNYQACGSWSPDSSAFCFPAVDVKDGPVGLWACDAKGQQLRRLTPPECGAVDKPYWRKDGWIAFGANYQRADGSTWMRDLWLVRPTGSTVLRRVTHGGSTDWQQCNSYGLYRCTPDERYGIARWYFPDPVRHPVDDWARGWAYVDMQTGEVIPAVWTEIGGNIRDTDSPYWEMSPDGEKFFCRWGESELENLQAREPRVKKVWQTARVFDLKTRTHREVLRFVYDEQPLRFSGWPSFSPDGKRVYFTVVRVMKDGSLESDVAWVGVR